MDAILYYHVSDSQHLQGYAFSGRPLAHGDWTFWWAIGNKIDNIMVVR